MKKIKIFVVCLLFLLLTSCGLNLQEGVENKLKTQSSNLNADGLLHVSIIDVGQGDSILIKTPAGRFIIVDGGSKEEFNKFFGYLESQNINAITTVIATHPHEDHIGNLDDVIMEYPVNEVYMPKVTANTKTFRDLMEAIKSKGLRIKTAKSGVRFNLDGVDFEFLAPNSKWYEDLNNYSAVLKVSYGQNSFLLMGDAEKLSESEILKKGFNVKADVIKIGHHGSSSSSSKAFIKAVNPKYAVISLGKNNDYGHPHRETIKLLNDLNISICRTDINGTVSFVSNGKNIKIYKSK
jgi:competence protein ComEC